MAEGWTRALHGEQIEPYSAGIEKHGLNARAVSVMMEVGIDISHHHSKTVEELSGVDFDLVVTVCSHAEQTCPRLLSMPRTMYVGFDNPPQLALQAETEEEAFEHYRRVRDEIRDLVKTLPHNLGG